MAGVKLVGSINLAKLSNVGIMNVKGKTATKKCVVIPIEENDIYIKVEDKVSQSTGQPYKSVKYNVGIEIYEKREPDQFGNTHYAKKSVSKAFIDSHTEEEVAAMNKIYLGDFKPKEIPDGNMASTIDAPTTQADEGDDLPF